MRKNKNRNFDAGKTTKTGEMVPSMFAWREPEQQKIIANKLAKLTQK